ncbi:endo-1,4-beta-xylanase [Anaeromicropila herbilytica]|uniref:Beta-xylanase n=1 Tax=Anaeromicropila herbilytica TaxID=2785025 RepID=A0A7R7EJV6_9FIRM|nr:endo-1,4-beta-xylanase [Anaeromicropila herbilytica]BCN30074.1 beta-xylanase [Anaeromicropila herbilytica]
MTLKEKYKDYFKVGVAVNEETIVSHKDIITEHFNSITCENAMKYNDLCDEHGNYHCEKADLIYEFAKENNLAIRGHNFVWHQAIPTSTLEKMQKEELLERITEHIQKVAMRYPNIYCWDVVNEAISDDKESYWRETVWYKVLGEDYIDTIFRIAREAVPTTSKLYYNDYNEFDSIKSDKIYTLIKHALDRGVPIEGLGCQCHINISQPSVDTYRRALEKYAKLGVRLQITEMDVSIYSSRDMKVENMTGREIEAQAKVYADYFKLFREYHEIIDAVTLWGVADDATWLDNFPVKNRKDAPLLFGVDHEPKEALLRIMDF